MKQVLVVLQEQEEQNSVEGTADGLQGVVELINESLDEYYGDSKLDEGDVREITLEQVQAAMAADAGEQGHEVKAGWKTFYIQTTHHRCC